MLNNVMSKSNCEAPNRLNVGFRLDELRAAYGRQDWLTVVGGVTGCAYRLAGLAGDEFGALLRAQIEERGRLLIHFRRKPIMRLRKGFDDKDGGIFDDEGLTDLKLHFGGGSYYEDEGRLTAVGSFPTALLVTGALNRTIGRILKSAPRCLGGLRLTALRATRGGLEFDVRDSFETLAPMPDEVADELGIERQRHLGHIPWLGYEGPAPVIVEPSPAMPAVTVAARRCPADHGRPQLRLVGLD